MKLSEVITDKLVYDIARRCLPETDYQANQRMVRRIAEEGATIAAARLGVTFDPED